jgi:hypothetical protein
MVRSGVVVKKRGRDVDTTMMTREPRYRPLRDGDRWGRWYLDLHTNSEVAFVCFQRGLAPSEDDYYVSSDRLHEDDWLYHIAQKVWCSEADVFALARALVAVGAAIKRGEIPVDTVTTDEIR